MRVGNEGNHVPGGGGGRGVWGRGEREGMRVRIEGRRRAREAKERGQKCWEKNRMGKF